MARHRKGLLTPFYTLTASWSYAYATADHEDRPAGSVSAFVLDNALRLSYTITDKDTNKQQEYIINVPLEWTPCTYGGTRPYFTCPDCHRRVLKLDKPLSHATFSCRLARISHTRAVRTRKTTLPEPEPAPGDHVVNSA
ncbi:MAG TPA: hypothetical protein VEG44_07420 [Candidatus Acidoferrales bacterium]|nr:hypothetical protein [Candidatus Acidoferrales bacterium]